MATLLQDAVAAELSAQQPWPNDVKLFQPYSVAQSLIPDSASVFGVKAYLRMCGLKYNDELRTNVEFMSPSGKIPFIKCGPIVISELEPIISFIQNKGYSLSEHLTDTEKADMKAYMSLVEDILVNAELYLTWKDKDIFQKVTKSRYGAPYTWPLSTILPLKKQWQMIRYLKAAGWAEKSFDKVCEDVKTCCEALSEKLGEQEYFFGTKSYHQEMKVLSTLSCDLDSGPFDLKINRGLPRVMREKATDLDAMVYGHLYTLTTTQIPVTSFAEIVNSFPNLTALVQKIEKVYFQDLQLSR